MKLSWVLSTLIGNALRHTPEGGSVEVSADRSGQALRLSVSDTGPGIPPERMTRIFDPFFTTKARGTGLGLAMAQEIAQEHGGQLLCESTVGKGTTFRLRLPAAPAVEQAPAPAIASA